MLDATKLLTNALGEHLAKIYRRTFGSREPGTVEVIAESARLTIERIAQSDALDHDADHTTLVTLVMQDILRGRVLAEGVSPRDGRHAIVAALDHDIGPIRGSAPATPAIAS